MGLGKTVEVIACILCHSKPSSEVKSFDYTLTASEPHTDTSSTCNSMIQEGSKSKLAECENNDYDEAVKIAKNCPIFEHDGTVEVREIMPMEI